MVSYIYIAFNSPSTLTPEQQAHVDAFLSRTGAAHPKTLPNSQLWSYKSNADTRRALQTFRGDILSHNPDGSAIYTVYSSIKTYKAVTAPAPEPSAPRSPKRVSASPNDPPKVDANGPPERVAPQEVSTPQTWEEWCAQL